MAELSLRDITLSFGGAPLLDGLSMHIEPGERVGLVGRNGCGKSTLLKVLSGELEQDEGERTVRPGAIVASLPQDVPTDLTGNAEELLSGALRKTGVEDWEIESRVSSGLAWLGVDPTEPLASMSAGSVRRALLARAVAMEADVLVLDEPTNHLDVDIIRDLEGFLGSRSAALVFVTHDRAFLASLATRIVELDRGSLSSHSCDYPTFLERREAELDAEAQQDAKFDAKLAKEEAWLRRGVKARRTRNMGRVRALRDMRNDRAARRDVTGRAKARVQEADRTGQVVLRAKGLSHAFGDKVIVENLDLEIDRGDRIGILGPNGAGKTTLLRLLLGELEPDAGEVRHGTKLEVARFDQLHGTLDPTKTVQENITNEGDMVTVNGKSRHVMSYLQDFLFTPDQVRGTIRYLSGGERNRLALAQLLVRPCNVLILDEPTNDLDVETLELLEELLSEFQGTVLVVSHDRAFVDNVVTSTLVFDGDDGVREFVGGYTDWLAWRETRDAERSAQRAEQAEKAARKAKAKPQASAKVKKLTYGEKLELEKLPARIEELETKKSELEAEMSAPAFYQLPHDDISRASDRLAKLTLELDEVYARWETLETLASGAE